jgi:hypothetical protein
MGRMEPVTFIIRHKNEPLNLIKTLKRMAAAAPGMAIGDEVIVCDDDTPDLDQFRGAIDGVDVGGRLLRRGANFRLLTAARDWSGDESVRTGPQAMCNLGAAHARNKTLCFLDAHMDFEPDWRRRLPASMRHEFIGGGWKTSPADVWSGLLTLESLGTRWVFNQGPSRIFNFRHVHDLRDNEAVKIPMSGVYIVRRADFQEVRGFRCLEANHGMEFIMAAKFFTFFGTIPHVDPGIPIGHVNQLTPRGDDYVYEGLANGARMVALLDGWREAIEWVATWADCPARDDVVANLVLRREELEEERGRLFNGFDETRQWLNPFCTVFGIEPPRKARRFKVKK